MSDQAATTEASAPELSYFAQRCAALGLTPDRNIMAIPQYPAMKGSPIIEQHLLDEDQKTGDILIHLYDLQGNPQVYSKGNASKPGSIRNSRAIPISIRRYVPGTEPVNKKGKAKKYDNPFGAKALPWISPSIIEAFRNKTQIDTIVITEGQLKALSGWLNGLHVFGISGIQGNMDKDTKTLHPDIITVITNCKVKNVVLLYDGDCDAVRSKDIEEGKDLFVRPRDFFNAAQNARELLKDHCKNGEFDIYFAHVNDELDGNPKGLDDLFEIYRDEAATITKEITTFSKRANHYFNKVNITAGLSKVYAQLHIGTVETFYQAHNQVINQKPFIYSGTKYQWDNEKNQLKVIIPGAAKFYFRVGDHYFKHIRVPNKYGDLEGVYHRRSTSTIIQDHGKEFIQYIDKYEAFCCKPDHRNYQMVIHNCFNRYRPFSHEPDDESSECPEILAFMRHIFGDQVELGLDYIQLLYHEPTQKLPILCLVSKENTTGKSTFGFLMKEIFTENMTTIGNADLESDFNGNWADKLIICCEEVLVDKKRTVEKIKALSMGNKIQMNMKGIDQVEIDFFGKFIFMSNNEDNFIIANEHDERFWVRRVPTITTERVDVLKLMKAEIPSFLRYLNTRVLSTKNEGRMWFNKKLLVTDALKKLIEGNKSGAERDIVQFIRQMMLEHGFVKLQYSLKFIVEQVLRRKYAPNYVESLLKDRLKLKTSGKTVNYKYPVETSSPDGSGAYEDTIALNSGNGKPFTFEASRFLTPEEIETIDLSEYAKSIGQETTQVKMDSVLDESRQDIILNSGASPF